VVAFRKREKKDITNPTIVSYNDSAVIFLYYSLPINSNLLGQRKNSKDHNAARAICG
jgi:hypothetical protein